LAREPFGISNPFNDDPAPIIVNISANNVAGIGTAANNNGWATTTIIRSNDVVLAVSEGSGNNVRVVAVFIYQRSVANDGAISGSLPTINPAP
jgi:hypothetical protein